VRRPKEIGYFKTTHSKDSRAWHSEGTCNSN
jgi:hypothetical protein